MVMFKWLVQRHNRDLISTESYRHYRHAACKQQQMVASMLLQITREEEKTRKDYAFRLPRKKGGTWIGP